jgi:hypothetical protein
MEYTAKSLLDTICNVTDDRRFLKSYLHHNRKSFVFHSNMVYEWILDSGRIKWLAKFKNIPEEPLLFSLNASPYRPSGALLFMPLQALSAAVDKKRKISYVLNHMLIAEEAFYFLANRKSEPIRIEWSAIEGVASEGVNETTCALWVYLKDNEKPVVVVLDAFIWRVVTQDIIPLKQGEAPYHSKGLQSELQDEKMAMRLLKSKIDVDDNQRIEAFCQENGISKRACEIALQELGTIEDSRLFTPPNDRCIELWKRTWIDKSKL